MPSGLNYNNACHKLMDHKYFLNRHHRIAVDDVNGSAAAAAAAPMAPMKCNEMQLFCIILAFGIF